jgi:hypothetical protein
MSLLSRTTALSFALCMAACGDTTPTPDPGKTTAAVTTSSAAPSATTTQAAVDTAAPSSSEVVVAPPEVSASASAGTATTAIAKTTPTGSATVTAAPTASADPEANKGDEKKGPSFSAYLAGAKSYKAGQPATVTAIVSPMGEYKINQEYPFKMTLDGPPSGISFPEKVVRNVSRTEKRASISIPFTAEKAGTATISGTCSLSVCTKDACVIEKVPLAVSVKIE